MSEKQAKLLRYFMKHCRDLESPKMLRKIWPHLNHKLRGKISAKIKKAIVITMAVQAEKARRQQVQNLDILKGFVNA